jgi:hypothetical protein
MRPARASTRSSPFLRRRLACGTMVCSLFLTHRAAAAETESAALAKAPALVIGAQTHFAQGWDPRLVAQVAESGLTDVRDELYWQSAEPFAGEFSFPDRFDNYMTALRQHGIRPLITLSFENRNYDGGQTPYTGAGFQAYARYARAILDHYGNQISAVEVWNEYNGSFAKGPATADRAGTYAKMLHVAYQAIKTVRPDLVVAGGATSGVPLPYFEKLFRAGALDNMDAVSIHPYRMDGAPEGIENQVAALRKLMERHGGGTKPIWVTEIGWPLRTAEVRGELTIDEPTQAKFLVRACALLASAGVARVYWYVFNDDRSTPGMGLLQGDRAHTPRAAYAAMKTLNARLRGATFIARERTDRHVYALRFASADGRELRVLWALSPFTVPVPAGTTMTSLSGQPVASSGGTLSVTDAPVYVSGPLPALAKAGTAPAAAALADSASGFSLQQGENGWSYGYFVGDSTNFEPLTETRGTDWKEAWTGRFRSLILTNTEQHPAVSSGKSIAAVRRWVSTTDGSLHVTARFKKVGPKGDGVHVRVLVDGRAVREARLNRDAGIAADFDFSQPAHVGTVFDFAVDPGTAGNADYDATKVSVTIEPGE